MYMSGSGRWNYLLSDRKETRIKTVERVKQLVLGVFINESHKKIWILCIRKNNKRILV